MSARTSIIPSASAVSSAKTRVAAYEWQALAGELDSYPLRRLAEALVPRQNPIRVKNI